MTNLQLEEWVYRIIDGVKRNAPIEDSRVELKGEWVSDFNKTARQIAGHANAARGDHLLWIIGVDQAQGVRGVDYKELSDWLARLRTEFDGVMPHARDLNIETEGKTVVALLFATDRAPYVVRNPRFGKPDGGPVKWEVPWREVTTTRTATREDLVRLLAPLQGMPRAQVLAASASVYLQPRTGAPEKLSWSIRLEVYASYTGPEPLVFPLFQVTGEARLRGGMTLALEASSALAGRLGTTGNQPHQPRSLTIEASPCELVVSASGRFVLDLTAWVPAPEAAQHFANPLEVDVVMPSSGLDRPLSFRVTLESCRSEDTHAAAAWTYDYRSTRVP